MVIQACNIFQHFILMPVVEDIMVTMNIYLAPVAGNKIQNKNTNLILRQI